MKIKRFRGNITFLALFVLLASALIGVLVWVFMKNFLRYSDDITTYERTSYLAKAGTELWLAIVNSRNPWVEWSLWSGNTLTENFTCPYQIKEGESCPQQPTFSLSISGTARNFENCSVENPIKVWSGLSVIIPLFKDAELSSASEGLTKGNISPLEKAFESPLFKQQDWKIGLLSYDNGGNMLNITNIPSLSELSINPNQETYLVLANPTQNEQTLCITNQNGIPQESVKIVSIWFFKNKQFWTETLAKKALPDFLRGDNYLWGENQE